MSHWRWPVGCWRSGPGWRSAGELAATRAARRSSRGATRCSASSLNSNRNDDQGPPTRSRRPGAAPASSASSNRSTASSMKPTPDRKEAVRASPRDERRLRRSFRRGRFPPLRTPARGVAHDVPRVTRHDPRAARSQWSGEVHAARDARDGAASVFRQHPLRHARHIRRHRHCGHASACSGHDLFLYPELTARENLAFFAGPLRHRREQCAARVRRSRGPDSTRAARTRSRASRAGCGSVSHSSAR